MSFFRSSFLYYIVYSFTGESFLVLLYLSLTVDSVNFHIRKLDILFISFLFFFMLRFRFFQSALLSYVRFSSFSNISFFFSWLLNSGFFSSKSNNKGRHPLLVLSWKPSLKKTSMYPFELH